MQQWDGKEWKIVSGYYKADLTILDPMQSRALWRPSMRPKKKITPRDCSKES